MKRITAALLALPLLAASAMAGDAPGDYYYRNLWAGKAHRGEARVKADTETCIVRAGYPNLATQLRFATRDPAYVGCMRTHGWALQYYTPPHRSYAGHGHHIEPSSSGSDSNDSSQVGIDAANAANAADQNAAAQAQNAAAQAQNAADTAATQLYMNQQ
jgi:hypothetical protein